MELEPDKCRSRIERTKRAQKGCPRFERRAEGPSRVAKTDDKEQGARFPLADFFLTLGQTLVMQHILDVTTPFLARLEAALPALASPPAHRRPSLPAVHLQLQVPEDDMEAELGRRGCSEQTASLLAEVYRTAVGELVRSSQAAFATTWQKLNISEGDEFTKWYFTPLQSQYTRDFGEKVTQLAERVFAEVDADQAARWEDEEKTPRVKPALFTEDQVAVLRQLKESRLARGEKMVLTLLEKDAVGKAIGLTASQIGTWVCFLPAFALGKLLTFYAVQQPAESSRKTSRLRRSEARCHRQVQPRPRASLPLPFAVRSTEPPSGTTNPLPSDAQLLQLVHGLQLVRRLRPLLRAPVVRRRGRHVPLRPPPILSPERRLLNELGQLFPLVFWLLDLRG